MIAKVQRYQNQITKSLSCEPKGLNNPQLPIPLQDVRQLLLRNPN